MSAIDENDCAIDVQQCAALIINASGRIVTWNSRCRELFQREAAQVLRQPFALLLAPAAQHLFGRLFGTLPEGGGCAEEVEIVRGDGTLRTCNVQCIPQLSLRGGFAGAILLAAAVPERAVMVGNLRLSAFRDMVGGPLYVLSTSGQFVMWNRHVERVTQLGADELAHVNVLELFEEHERALVAQKVGQVFAEDAEVLVEASLRARDGTLTPFLFSGRRFMCHQQYYLCGMGVDLSARRAQEAILRLRERALHASSNGIVITGCAGRDNPIEYINPAFERITGYSAAEVLGRDSRFMAAHGIDESERAELRAAISAQREAHVVLRNVRKDGELFWNDLTITPVTDEHGAVGHFIGVINDVTASKQRTARLEHEVNHDPLTGLANRNLLWDRLDQAAHQAQRNKSMMAVMLLDLNNFKLINDSLGHEAGDQVLIVVAKRLQASVREVDTVARLAGDEFVLVLTDQPSLRYTLRMIERLRLGMAKPVAFNGKEIAISASMGVSLYPHDGTNVDDLVQAADVAMYHAKAAGKGEVHFFSDDMKLGTEAKQALEQHLRRAVEKDEIFLQFQPRLCLHSGQIVGIEALLRWRHPARGVLLPEAFLAEAEENGTIVAIGERVFEQVCELLRRMGEQGLPPLPVSMNASYREFSQNDFIGRIARRLEALGIARERFEIELKEEHLMRNQHLSTELAAEMSKLGIRLSVDHFGAGPSNLAYLEKLPIKHLKIANSCVREICVQGVRGTLAKTMIDIAHNLHVPVVADGVETLAQAEFLRANGCDEVQGSYFSAPLARPALEQLLRPAAH